MSSHRVRLTAVVATAVLTVFAAGCSDDDDSSAAPSTSTVTTTGDVETTTSTTTTTGPPTSPPPSTAPTTTPPPTSPPSTPPTSIAPGDWSSILTELSRRRVALYAAPDLSRIGEYCMPATDCEAQLQAQLGDAIARGQHIEGQQPFTVVSIERVLEGQPGPGGAVTDVVAVVAPTAQPPARIVDGNGNVVSELTGTSTNTRGVFRLVQWNDPTLPWRVVSVEELGAAS